MAAPAAVKRLSDGAVALLSIHPRYAEAILAGAKRVELRKAPLRPDTTHVAIYATKPVQRLMGVFSISHFDIGSPDELWSRYADVAAIDRESFDQYYSGRDVGVAIGVAEVVPMRSPTKLDSLRDGLSPPQNVVYLDREAARRLEVLVESTQEPVTPLRGPVGLAARLVRRGLEPATRIARALAG